MKPTFIATLVAIGLGSSLSVLGCRQPEEQTPVPYFIVQTWETIAVNGTPFTYAASITISGNVLLSYSGSIGVVNAFGPAITSRTGYYTINNARTPAKWRFLAITGGCAGQYYQFADPLDPFAPKTTAVDVNNRDSFRLACVPVTIRQVNLSTETLNLDGEIVPKTCCNTDTLYANQALQVNESLTSANGQYYLYYQVDGNLSLYDTQGNTPWTSETPDTSYGQAVMQSDGNFVLYNGSGAPVWFSGTGGNPGAFAKIEGDGKLVVYSPYGYLLWSSTGGSSPPPTGRWKSDGAGGCYWDPHDSGADQCSPPTGRWKLDGAGGCYWDATDSGPDQCVPGTLAFADVSRGRDKQLRRMATVISKEHRHLITWSRQRSEGPVDNRAKNTVV